MQHVQAGVVLLDEGKADQALELFEKAYGMDPVPLLLGHMAKAHVRKGDLQKARELYERWLSAETDPRLRARAGELLGEVLDQIPGRLVVTASPSGAAVTVDGHGVETGGAVELKRGDYEVAVSLRGHRPEKRTARVEAGGETRLKVDLLPLPGRILVRGVPAGATVTVGGKDGRTLPMDLPFVVPPGRHVLEATAEGYEKKMWTVEVGPDGALTEDVALVALPPAAKPALPPAEVAAREVMGVTPDEGVSRRTEVRSSPWPWVSIGTGAAALVVGGVMSGLAFGERSKVSNADQSEELVTGMTREDALSHVDKAKTYDTVSYVMYGVGSAALVTGIVLAVTLPKKRAETRGAVPAVGASPVPGGMAVGVAGRF